MPARKAIPYVSHGPVKESTRLPIDSPTTDTRRHFHSQSFIGLITRGIQKLVVPIQHPWAGEGAEFPAFPKVRGSAAAPDLIRVPVLVAINNFSAMSHSNPLSAEIPPRAINPRPKPQRVAGPPRGTGGHYTIPDPKAYPKWPTSSDYVANRMVR